MQLGGSVKCLTCVLGKQCFQIAPTVPWSSFGPEMLSDELNKLQNMLTQTLKKSAWKLFLYKRLWRSVCNPLRSVN